MRACATLRPSTALRALRRSMSADAGSHAFGPHRVAQSEVFAETRLSLGFVNLKPVVPGARAASGLPTPCARNALATQ